MLYYYSCGSGRLAVFLASAALHGLQLWNTSLKAVLPALGAELPVEEQLAVHSCAGRGRVTFRDCMVFCYRSLALHTVHSAFTSESGRLPAGRPAGRGGPVERALLAGNRFRAAPLRMRQGAVIVESISPQKK
jgi:hypothetical protein